MTRKLTVSFFASTISAAGFFFVVTAQPARLYAEVGAAPPMCTVPEIAACQAAALGDTCALGGGTGLCFSAACREADGGAFITNARICRPRTFGCSASQQQLDDCAGKNTGDVCGSGGHCADIGCPLPDGSSERNRACVYTGASPDGGDAPPGDESGGCAASPVAPVAGLTSMLSGLVVALAALLRRRRVR